MIPRTDMGSTRAADSRCGQYDVAIVGMACMFPGAPDLDTYWNNIVAKVDAIGDPPQDAWDPGIYYDTNGEDADRVYCKKGGYLGPLAYFDPLAHGIPPVAVGGEPDQWLALKVAKEALADAGYPDGPMEGSRTAVILGKGAYLNHGNLNMVQHSLVIGQTVQILKRLHPEYTEDDIHTIREDLKRCLPLMGPETASGLIPNIIAGRIANRLDLTGPAYTVDAACASSLVSVDIAVRDLISGKYDLAVVGGAQVSTPLPIFVLFCQLNVLSRQQQIRPFDKDADGTVLGEGIGMVVLKRRVDAERDGNRIYALIKGVGVSSDGRGLSVMAPRVEGEVVALKRAYEMADVPPLSVQLIEAHGTGTLGGDLAEIQALREVFGRRENGRFSCALGTVKSMIGHTLPAAGIAGLIKAALALYHKTLPPMLNCDEPNPRLELRQTPFYINTEFRPWVHDNTDSPRRAGVNAFGFGGINAHVILEEHPGDRKGTGPSHNLRWQTEVLVLQGDARTELVRRSQDLADLLATSPQLSLKDLAYTLNTNLDEKSYRLAIVADSLSDLQTKLNRALNRLADPGCKQIKDRAGIYFFEPTQEGLGRLAFIFPGEGAQYENMLADLCLHFPEVQACFDQIDGVFVRHPRGYVPSDFIFPRTRYWKDEHDKARKRLWQIDGAIEALLAANHALFTLLGRLDIRPDALVGHSTGEYSAMRASGILDLTDRSVFTSFVLDLHRLHEGQVVRDGIPHAAVVAVGADRAQVSTLVEEVGGELYVAMDNCPHQTVIVGESDAVTRAIERMKRVGLIYQTLPFDRAYHTPSFQRYLGGLREFFARFPVSTPAIQTWSCSTASALPADVNEIRKLIVEQWARPVEFTKTIEAMYAHGVRIFVEVGPRGNLTAFVGDILRGMPHLAVPANVERRSGTTQLNHLVGMLAAKGVPMKLDYLYAQRDARHVTFDGPSFSENAPSPVSTSKKLATGWPAMQLSEDVVQLLRSRSGQLGMVERANGDEQNGEHASPSPDHTGLSSESPAGAQAVAGEATTAAEPARDSRSSSFSNDGITEIGPRLEAQGASPSPLMSAYFATMDKFLQTQQEVMEAFLAVTRSPVDTGKPSGDDMHVPHTATEEAGHDPGPLSAIPEDGRHESETVVPQERSPEALKSGLLALVSERTGYPVAFLDLNADMEGDLGIDSIKRVEIVGGILARFGVSPDDRLDSISGVRTLQHLLDWLIETCNESQRSSHTGKTNGDESTTVNSGWQGQETGPGRCSSPLIRSVQSLVRGRELVGFTRLAWDEDLYLHDHTLGRHISVTDPSLTALPLMPLAMSMEVLAEAGALVVPDKLLVGMKDVNARRWISMQEEAVVLKVLAHCRPDSSNEVEVRIVETGGQDEGGPASETPVVEGILVFDDAYPAPCSPESLTLTRETPSKWTPDALYASGMFHGERWRGVVSVDRCGDDGAVATIRVLPFTNFFRSNPAPVFVTDPVVLDAAGQVVGFWAQEQLKSGFIVFPFRLKELRLYGANLPTHTQVRCQTRIRMTSEAHITSDMDLVGPDGKLWMRLEGWEDRRFDLPMEFFKFLLAPVDGLISEPCTSAVAQFPASLQVQCRRLKNPFHSDRSFWTRVWSRLTLSAAERRTFEELRGPETRRMDWLLGRMVAKDAVRLLMKQVCNLELCPTDVQIVSDGRGQPVPQGPWTRDMDRVPALSLAHTEGGMAVAIASLGEQPVRVGVDVERIRCQPAGFEEVAFAPDERALLNSLQGAAKGEWMIRLWCAKEAVAKCLGSGLVEGPASVVIRSLDLETGVVLATVQGKLTSEFPELVEAGVQVNTTIDGEYAVASALWEAC